MKILFERNEKAILPEIENYINYFNSIEGFEAFDSAKVEDADSKEKYDVIWEFKGTNGYKNPNKIIVHEYASLSIGRVPHLKNTVKKIMNFKPDLRVFPNVNVKNGFNFKDSVPSLYRDMGINEHFIREPLPDSQKEYDFVYIGAITEERKISIMIDEIVNNKLGKLLLVGEPKADVYSKYKHIEDITFTGNVPYNEVPDLAIKSIYGLNFIPDIYPFNLQTSTKLQEYVSLNLKVISTEYKWVRQFMNEHNTQFYTTDYSNFRIDMDEVRSFNYINNFNSRSILWENIFEQSGLKEKLLELYNDKNR